MAAVADEAAAVDALAAVEAVAAEVVVTLNAFWAKYFPMAIISKFPENFSQFEDMFFSRK